MSVYYVHDAVYQAHSLGTRLIKMQASFSSMYCVKCSTMLYIFLLFFYYKTCIESDMFTDVSIYLCARNYCLHMQSTVYSILQTVAMVI